jgi:tRNA dimethylallyltransferase
MMNVIFVVGPTASGKSTLALELALKNRGVILNCDSVQVYSHIQIGAAKPTPEEMQIVPHYLYGHVLPPIEYTAGMYRRDFFQQLTSLDKQGIENIYVVGGTGFYFQAIEKGMFEIQESSKDLIEELEQLAATNEGYALLLEELKQGDPETFKLFHPNDRYRVLRAIEILRTSRRRPSDLRKEKLESQTPFPYPLKKIGIQLDRSCLHQRIHERVKKMLKQGLIDEVIELNKLNLQNWAPLKSVGYKEVQLYLSDEIPSLSVLEEQILISTRQLAKRQMTWFNRDKEIYWQSFN